VNNNERFDDFNLIKILLPVYKVFAAGQQFHKKKLSSLLKTIQDLKSHSFKIKFEKA